MVKRDGLHGEYLSPRVREEAEKFLKRSNCKLILEKTRNGKPDEYKITISKPFFIKERELGIITKKEKIVVAEQVAKKFGVSFSLKGWPDWYEFSCLSGNSLEEIKRTIAKLNEIVYEFGFAIGKYEENRRNNILSLAGLKV